jgi:hypothetical protein
MSRASKQAKRDMDKMKRKYGDESHQRGQGEEG